MTHPFTDHEIVRLRHEERVGRAHAAMHALEAREAREARSTKSDAVARRTNSWFDRLRRRESAAPQTPARTGTS